METNEAAAQGAERHTLKLPLMCTTYQTFKANVEALLEVQILDLE